MAYLKYAWITENHPCKYWKAVEQDSICMLTESDRDELIRMKDDLNRLIVDQDFTFMEMCIFFNNLAQLQHPLNQAIVRELMIDSVQSSIWISRGHSWIEPEAL